MGDNFVWGLSVLTDDWIVCVGQKNEHQTDLDQLITHQKHKTQLLKQTRTKSNLYRNVLIGVLLISFRPSRGQKKYVRPTQQQWMPLIWNWYKVVKQSHLNTWIWHKYADKTYSGIHLQRQTVLLVTKNAQISTSFCQMAFTNHVYFTPWETTSQTRPSWVAAFSNRFHSIDLDHTTRWEGPTIETKSDCHNSSKNVLGRKWNQQSSKRYQHNMSSVVHLCTCMTHKQGNDWHAWGYFVTTS